MHNILRSLGGIQTVLDWGCGRGSSNYKSQPCRIIGLDMSLRDPSYQKERSRIYIQSDAQSFPLKNGSIER